MRNREVDKLLEAAIILIKVHLLKDRQAIPKEFESAAASFGAAVIQTGPVPACALYLKSSKSTVDKSGIVFILIKLIQEQGGFKGKEIQEPADNSENPKEWMKQIINETPSHREELFKQRLFTAIIALKLALRTFKLEQEAS